MKYWHVLWLAIIILGGVTRAAESDYRCAGDNHVVWIRMGFKPLTGRPVVGLLSLQCSDGAISPGFGGTFDLERIQAFSRRKITNLDRCGNHLKPVWWL